jgi:hypothetical protein
MKLYNNYQWHKMWVMTLNKAGLATHKLCSDIQRIPFNAELKFETFVEIEFPYAKCG